MSETLTPYDLAPSYYFMFLHDTFAMFIEYLTTVAGIACLVAVVLMLLSVIVSGYERNVERDRLRQAAEDTGTSTVQRVRTQAELTGQPEKKGPDELN